VQSPGFVIHNDTIWPVEVSLAQVGPLYWEVVPPGKTFTRSTGAVWFTINGQVALDGKEHISTWDAVWPVASIIGTIALGAVTGGVGAFASAGTFAATAGVISSTAASALVAGGAVATDAIVITGALGGALSALIKGGLAEAALAAIFNKQNATVSKYGCYAGPPWPFRNSVHEYRISGGPTYKDAGGGKVELVPGAMRID
jgi:hypothetical protein